MALNNRETQPLVSHFRRHLEQGQLCPRHSRRLQGLRATATVRASCWLRGGSSTPVGLSETTAWTLSQEVRAECSSLDQQVCPISENDGRTE